MSTPKLRKAGLSRAKVAAVRDLAQKTIDGVVPSIAAAEKMTDQEIIDRLISVRGIGAWTVEMFLIFRLGRPDVLPIHDYGVQKGWALTYRKKFIPKPKVLLKFGERWRPYRAYAVAHLWASLAASARAHAPESQPEAQRRQRRSPDGRPRTARQRVPRAA